LVALPAEELAQLLLERLLQDQSCAETTNRLDRIILVADTGNDLVELAAQPLARNYARHQGVPPRRLPGQRGGYARLVSPGSRDATLAIRREHAVSLLSALAIEKSGGRWVDAASNACKPAQQQGFEA